MFVQIDRLNLFVRRNLPEPFKVGLRVVRLLTTAAPVHAPTVPQIQLDGCRLYSRRDEMLDSFPKGGRVAEIGTQYGYFAREILARCSPDELHLVDITFRDLVADVRADRRVHLYEDLSITALARFEDAWFDWIYIDADHSYQAAKADIAAAVPKLKPGGLLVFNDFARMVRPGFGTFGVHQAVCEFAVESGWPFVAWALQGEALYDVALRKPA